MEWELAQAAYGRGCGMGLFPGVFIFIFLRGELENAFRAEQFRRIFALEQHFNAIGAFTTFQARNDRPANRAFDGLYS